MINPLSGNRYVIDQLYAGAIGRADFAAIMFESYPHALFLGIAQANNANNNHGTANNGNTFGLTYYYRYYTHMSFQMGVFSA